MAAFLVTAVQSSADAASITIINRTGKTITEGYFRVSGTSDFGNDQLAEYVQQGQSHHISFEEGYRYWDCWFVLEDGTARFSYNLDVETVGTLYVD
ncbi:MAG: hypothetical protein IJ774_13945 [Selenomonadaceae bacterium]|nr:hypothetical protein [Selenomonadaceae bacterium]MBR1807474.1 hypothetical protein [Selenomonadaceae bacterium]